MPKSAIWSNKQGATYDGWLWRKERVGKVFGRIAYRFVAFQKEVVD